MARRDLAKNTARWLSLGGVGIFGGLFLGWLAVGNGITTATPGYASYAELTGNPDARSVDIQPVEPCFDCAGGYGSAGRLAASRFERSDNAYRALGTVDIDYAAQEAPPDDGYRYGGRFPDQIPHIGDAPVAPSPTPAKAAVQIREVGESKLVRIVPPASPPTPVIAAPVPVANPVAPPL